jgi:hypothetical protein
MTFALWHQVRYGVASTDRAAGGKASAGPVRSPDTAESRVSPLADNVKQNLAPRGELPAAHNRASVRFARGEGIACYPNRSFMVFENCADPTVILGFGVDPQPPIFQPA